jgi:RHS repeat-associated protein
MGPGFWRNKAPSPSDANKQLTGVQIPGTGSITYPSYIWNRPASMTLPGGSTKEFTYDPLMRTQSITTKDPGQNPLMNYAYTYDRMDNIVSKVTEHVDYAYGYDDLYRLTGADNPIQDDEAYTYDPVGNRLTSADSTGTWTYNDNNELNAHNGVTYEYDNNGNMIQKTVAGVVTNFIYNAEDRLIEVRDGSDSLIASYYYDPFGRRLWKEVGGSRTYFLYTDEGLIGEYDSTGTEIKTYGYKPGSTWTTDPLFMKVGDDYYFYQNDHLGTPQKMAAVNGGVVWSAKYEAFGKANVEVNIVENNLRFPGQYFDQETGLYYNWKRFYSSIIGRYIGKDPIGLAGGINTFAYVENNPINAIDSLGLYAIDRFGKPIGPGGPNKETAIQCMNRIAKKYENMNVSDKYKHCMSAGEIYSECGPLSSYIASFGKEFKDLLGPGDASFKDLAADFDGIGCAKESGEDKCGKPLTLDECCKKKGRRP